MMNAKVNDLNTAFFRGIVTSQTNQTIFCNTHINCQGSLPTNDPSSSLNPKIQTKPKSLKVTICFYELII